MLQSILVGLDGSGYSTAAVELGIRWAQKCDALLVGLGVIDEPTIRRPEPVPLGASTFKERRDDTMVADARRQVDQFLERFALRCAEAGVACKLLEDVGVPGERIVLEAQRYDLILLGQQTYFHFETQDQPDDTLRTVLKNSPRPVVTVPEQLGGGTAIVIAYDGSLQAARTLQMFQCLQLDRSADIHVVSVHDESSAAIRHAERAMEFLGFHGITAQRNAIGTSAAPASIILEQVRHLDAGLVVMGAYGQPALREFVFGSATRTMLKERTVPLFLYH